METYQLREEDLNKFLLFIMKDFELIAPVKKDLIRFEKISSPEQVFLEKNAYFPLKSMFFPPVQKIFGFTGKKIDVPVLDSPKRVFFGVKKCDLNAIKNQDSVFINDANDPYYKAARKNSYLIGYHCNSACNEYCFCGSMDLVDYFDLMLYKKKGFFLVEVGSEKGKYLISRSGLFKKSSRLLTQEEKKLPNDRLKKKDISKFYSNKEWEKAVSRCFSCTACTALCPNCYCFEIHDEVKMSDLKKGERIRKWSSCQLQEFTEVAGKHVFREKREERFKHRIYHQLDYFKKKYGFNLCTGCGRCIEGCPTRIDFVKLLNQMKE